MKINVDATTSYVVLITAVVQLLFWITVLSLAVMFLVQKAETHPKPAPQVQEPCQPDSPDPEINCQCRGPLPPADCARGKS